MKQNLTPYLFLVFFLMLFCLNGRANIKEKSISFKTHSSINHLTPELDSLDLEGKVTDSTGTAIEGVVITEKGTTNSTLSDQNGAYKLAVNPNGILVFLKSGFATQEVQVNNQQQLDIKLMAATPEIEEAEAQSTENPSSTNDSSALQRDSTLLQTDSSQNPAKDSSIVQSTGTTAVPTGQELVTGVVNGPTGPLPGITIKIVGTDLTASTDENGKFEIAAGPQNQIQFSSVGYKSITQTVGNRKDIQVVMQTETNTIESVQVVAVGYGTMKRATLPTAVSSIGANEIEDEVLPSITQAIQGKAGGVQVTQKSGSPGGGISIRVRGTTSINARSDPLYVVDGIPVNSTTNFTGGSTFDFGGGTQGINILSSLNPSDVQSIEVLKDAASSSIYGSRAANGVVLITTKKGLAGQSQFNFNMYEGFSQVPTERYYDFMNTSQFQDYMKDYYRILQEQDPTATIPDQIFANPDLNTDWQDAIFRTAATRNYELSASGGSDKTQYYTSVGYMKQGGVILSSDFDRLSGRLNLNHQHNDKLRFATSINLTKATN